MSNPLFTLTLSPEKTKKEFSDAQSLGQFIQNEGSAWNNVVPELYSKFMRFWNELRNELTRYPVEQQQVGTFQQVLSRSGQHLVYSETSTGRMLLEVSKTFGPAAADEAYLQIVGLTHPRDNLSEPKRLLGAVAAAIFEGAGQDEQVGAQLAAVVEVRTDLSQLRDSYSQSLKALETASAAFKEKQTDTFKNLETGLSDVFAKKLESLSKEFADSQEAWNVEVGKQRIQIQGLEAIYEEKLRLDRPARYWQKLERTYRNWGRTWLFLGALFSVAFMYFLAVVLYLPPDVLETHNLTEARGIRGLLIFALLTSIAVFLIRYLFKLSISSFHLSRDARERAQLTYFYLALLKSGGVSPENQNIILQSLFSRADTGLLKSEGLSMPGGTVDSILSGLGGRH